MVQHNLAIFASGTGSNALNIINYFKDNTQVNISFVLSNKIDAQIVTKAANEQVKVIVCTNEEVNKPNFLIEICEKHAITIVVLAGFLRKLPASFIQKYPNKIINIHPSLLPKYGGEGMYGKFVHEAVLKDKEKETGITIHFVNEEYDKGEHIAQFKFPINKSDNLESIQTKIHQYEQNYFPSTIEKCLQQITY